MLTHVSFGLGSAHKYGFSSSFLDLLLGNCRGRVASANGSKKNLFEIPAFFVISSSVGFGVHM